MEHQFNVDLAVKYGIEKAIIIHNLAWWIKHNIANNTHYYDERYWTYNSSKAFAELFPYMSESKIKRLLSELETKDGVLISGNYNKIPFDRTKWYSITDKYIVEIYSIHCSNLDNGEERNGRPIPYSKPDSKQDLISEIKKLQISNKLIDKFIEFLEYRKEIKKPLKTIRPITSEINKIGKDYQSEEHLIESIDFSMDKEYQGIFPTKYYKPNKDIKPSVDNKIINRITTIELLLDSSNIIYEKDKLFLEETLADDRYSDYKYILNKIKKADIV